MGTADDQCTGTHIPAACNDFGVNAGTARNAGNADSGPRLPKQALLGWISSELAKANELNAGSSVTSDVEDYYRNLSEYARDLRLLILAGALPVDKELAGLVRNIQSSRFTNALSHFGLKFMPNLKLGRQLLGTNRVFGLAGRLNLAAGVGLLSYDITSIVLSIQWSHTETVGDRLNETLLDAFMK